MLELFSKEYYGNTITRWILVCGLLLMLIVLRRILLFIYNKYLLKKAKEIIDKQPLKRVDEKKEEKTPGDIFNMFCWYLVKGPKKKKNKKGGDTSPIYAIINDVVSSGSIVLSVIAVKYICSLLYLPTPISELINTICPIVAVLITAKLLHGIYSKLHDNVFTPIADSTTNKLDDQLIGPIRHCVLFLIWAFAIIIALENAGYHVGALLTGLGIGGLAVAMAAKDTIANILGGFTIFTDKSFTLNDYIKIGPHQGYVRKHNIRSTVLATYGGSVIYIPNAKFTDGVVENFSRVEAKKVEIDLYLDYDNTKKQIKKAKKILDKIIKKHRHKIKGEPIVSFHNFGKSALNFKFTYCVNLAHIIPQNGSHIDGVFGDSQIVDIKREVNTVRTAINMQIFKQFKKANIEFQEALEIKDD